MDREQIELNEVRALAWRSRIESAGRFAGESAEASEILFPCVRQVKLQKTRKVQCLQKRVRKARGCGDSIACEIHFLQVGALDR